LAVGWERCGGLWVGSLKGNKKSYHPVF